MLRLLSLLTFAAAPADTGFVERTHTGGDDVAVRFQVFIPHNYTPAKKWPTILYLHGSGESGTDGNKQTEIGLGKFVRERAADFPFIVVFPQTQRNDGFVITTWFPDHPEGQRALAILESVQREFSVDSKRLYLTGNSMGGYGTWALAAKHPAKWAAIAPVCGGGDADSAPLLKRIPTWCFHGADDDTVPVTASRMMIDALKAAGASPKYDEYPGVKHNSWDKAYANNALYEWFLQHTAK